MKLPLVQYVENYLGYPSLIFLIEDLANNLKTNPNLPKYPIEAVDIDLLKKSLEEALNQAGLKVKIEDNTISVEYPIRLSKAEVMSLLKNSPIAQKIEKFYSSYKALSEEYVLRSSKDGKVFAIKEQRIFKISEKGELVSSFEENLYLLAHEMIVNWFIREFKKDYIDEVCLLKSTKIKEISYEPESVDIVEQVDILRINFEVKIEINGQVKTFVVSTQNWVEQERLEKER